MESNLRQYLLEECYAMVKHLSSYGKDIPTDSVFLLQCEATDLSSLEVSGQEILKLHRSLSKKVAPASPKTIWLLCKESNKSQLLKFLGPVGLVQRLMLTALVSLLVFIVTSLTKDINITSIGESIYDQSGVQLLIVMIFYLSAASLGASFSNLFQANSYIVNNNFDPKYESSYWTRYVLGIIAGIMLAVVIPVPEEAATNTGETTIAQLADASRPLLSMLGGFSASLVYRIMFRLVYAVESIFIGKQSEETERKLANLQTANDIELENNKQQFVNKLLQLKGQVNDGKSAQEIDHKLQQIIAELTS
jgi:hypothetical protein